MLLNFRLYFILIFTFCWATMLGAQEDKTVDSLENILSKNIQDSTRARIYIELAESIVDEKKWVAYNKKALDLANLKIPKTKGTEKKFFIRIKANATGNLGYLSDEYGGMSQAIDYYFQSLELYDRAGDEQGKAVIYGNLGVIYSNQKDYKEALDYCQKALAIKEKFSPEDVAVNYINIGVIHEELGDSTKALDFYRRGLYAAVRTKDEDNTATALNNIGSWHYNRKEYEKAIPFLKGAVRSSVLAGNEPGTGWVLANLGSSFISLNKLDSAKYYTKKALEIADKYDYPRLKESVYEKLYMISQITEDWRMALTYRNLSIGLVDSLENVGAQKEAIRQKLDYDHNLETEKNNLIREEEKKREQQRMYFILGGLALAIFFGIVLFSRLRITRKQKKIIEKQKVFVEDQHQEIVEKQKEITDSIQYAKRIQSAKLPSEKKMKTYLPHSFVLYLPKDIVAGDFYWLAGSPNNEESESPLLGDRILFAAADCTGHGVPGALVSVVCDNALNRSVNEFGLTDPGEILDKTREIVIQEFDQSDENVKDGMDIALLSLSQTRSLNRVEGPVSQLKYSGAHNPLWIIRKGATEIEEIKADKQPIGKFIKPKPFTTQSIELNKGDSIYIFSDGYVDQFGGEKGKKFKAKAFRELLLSIQNEHMDQQKEMLQKAFEKWRGDIEQIDDVCVIGVRI